MGDYLVVGLSTDEFNSIEKNKKTYFAYKERKQLKDDSRINKSAFIFTRTILVKIFRIMFLPLWVLQKAIKRNSHIIVFGSFAGRYFEDNSRALYEYIMGKKSDYRLYIITKSKDVFSKYRQNNENVLFFRSFKGWLISLKALWFITDHGMNDINIYATNGARIVFLWHGMPLKRIGFDDLYFKNNNKLLGYLNNMICPYYNNKRIYLLTSTSDFFKSFLSSGFSNDSGEKLVETKIINTGLPRTDIFFRKEISEFIADIKRKYKEVKIVFYLPTFRMSIYDNTVFNPFQGFGFDADNFFEVLEEKNIVFLYKPHPLEGQLTIHNENERFIRIADNSVELYAVLKDVDILLTDYSSVYFDFLLLKKSVILAPFDYDEYIKDRGLYFDYYQYMAGIKVYNWNQLLECFENETYYYPENANRIFNTWGDGNNCGRIFDIIEKNIK